MFLNIRLRGQFDCAWFLLRMNPTKGNFFISPQTHTTIESLAYVGYQPAYFLFAWPDAQNPSRRMVLIRGDPKWHISSCDSPK